MNCVGVLPHAFANGLHHSANYVCNGERIDMSTGTDTNLGQLPHLVHPGDNLVG